MKRLFIVLILLILILVSFSYAILKLLAIGSDDNFFNQKYRSVVAKNQFLRHVLGLHFDGDARFDYLNESNEKILIEVDEMQGLHMPIPALELLVERIKENTGKEATYILSDNNIPYQETVDNKQIEGLVSKYKNYQNNSKAYIYLIYLNKFQNREQLLGSTFQEYGIVLYRGALQEFTTTSPKTFDNYVASTGLHEFGHQLGLPHIEQENCLMQSRAEESHVAQENPADVITDFCDTEKQQIML